MDRERLTDISAVYAAAAAQFPPYNLPVYLLHLYTPQVKINHMQQQSTFPCLWNRLILFCGLDKLMYCIPILCIDLPVLILPVCIMPFAVDVYINKYM